VSGKNFTDTGTIQAAFIGSNVTIYSPATFISSTTLLVKSPAVSMIDNDFSPDVEISLNSQQFTNNGVHINYYGIIIAT